MTATDILLAFWLTSALIVLAAVVFAPWGYEDEAGWHAGKPEDEQ